MPKLIKIYWLILCLVIYQPIFTAYQRNLPIYQPISAVYQPFTNCRKRTIALPLV
ncbi:hypothetical protein ACJ2A9_17780 [Anaerobacillus sp. MEB173]|uniref:hypothetical protein n=1 Tax=Anaerobacillus sp. MEB173 TaxID=3383345 RepID=UPI003F939E7F